MTLKVVPAIIKINIFVFFMWFLMAFSYPQFMMENFLVSWQGLSEGRVWTLITSVFSHNMLFHIFLNMYVFYGFGMAMETVMGSKKFLYFYLTAGVVASLGHCFVSAYYLNSPELPALGASGAVSGVLVLFSLMFPNERVYLLGLIPIPALGAALLFVGLDLWGLIEQTRGASLPIGYGAHLGGALTGALYYLIYVRHHQFNRPFRI